MRKLCKRTIAMTALTLAGALVLSGCSVKKPVNGTPEDESGSVKESVEPSGARPHPSDEWTEEGEEGPGADASSDVPSTIEEFPSKPGESSSAANQEPPNVQEGGCDLLIASDLHYLAKGLTDFGDAFSRRVEHGDGKVTGYIWELTDAWIEEVKREKPDLVILSGDLSFNGEKKSHVELAGKLRRIKAAGIPVIVIPGNHDINNNGAVRFEGSETIPEEYISPEEFVSIYREFGYDEAVSRDTASLSYVYQIDDYNRALMLDSCQYETGNRIGGMIRESTYEWVEEQMEDAWDLGMNVIPVAHHNLLDESEVYVEDCTIEHSEQLIDQLNSWHVPLFLSGHLHVQHYMWEGEDGDGICEIVTSSLATPPCQYGLLHYGDDGSFRYRTRALDMEAWALKEDSENQDLLTFSEFGNQFLTRVFYNQAMDEFDRNDQFKELTKSQRKQMAEVFANLNSACYAGKVYEVKEKETARPGYKLWEETGYPSILSQYLESIVRDGTKDYNRLEVE